MGIVTGTATGQEFRELYFPAHERAMAHYSSASPDHKSALVVEMDENGELGAMPAYFPRRPLRTRMPIGPQGPCRSAGWSADGSWMYFTASVDGHSHLWRAALSGRRAGADHVWPDRSGRSRGGAAWPFHHHFDGSA